MGVLGPTAVVLSDDTILLLWTALRGHVSLRGSGPFLGDPGVLQYHLGELSRGLLRPRVVYLSVVRKVGALSESSECCKSHIQPLEKLMMPIGLNGSEDFSDLRLPFE